MAPRSSGPGGESHSSPGCKPPAQNKFNTVMENEVLGADLLEHLSYCLPGPFFETRVDHFTKAPKSHFFGEVSRAEALGLNCEGRPAAFAGRSEFGSSLLGIPLLPTRKGIPSSPSNAPSTCDPFRGARNPKTQSAASSDRRVQRTGPVTKYSSVLAEDRACSCQPYISRRYG
jgi:hypothetical protein